MEPAYFRILNDINEVSAECCYVNGKRLLTNIAVTGWPKKQATIANHH